MAKKKATRKKVYPPIRRDKSGNKVGRRVAPQGTGRVKPVSPALVARPKYVLVSEHGSKVGRPVKAQSQPRPLQEDEAGWNWATMGNKKGPGGIVLRKKGGKGKRR